MKTLNVNQMENLTGGLCINRPDPGQELSGIPCPGFCLATQIVVANTASGIGPDGLICIA